MRCQKDNGGCSHLCLITGREEGLVCACPDIMNLSEDGKTCVENGSMLLVSGDDDIRGVSLDAEPTETAMPIVRSGGAAAMDFVVESKSIFWLNQDGIVSAPLDGKRNWKSNDITTTTVILIRIQIQVLPKPSWTDPPFPRLRSSPSTGSARPSTSPPPAEEK